MKFQVLVTPKDKDIKPKIVMPTCFLFDNITGDLDYVVTNEGRYKNDLFDLKPILLDSAIEKPLKIYIVKKDAESHYGVTIIDKVFLKKQDADAYKLKKDNERIKVLEQSKIEFPNRINHINKSIKNVNEVFIIEQEVF